MATTLELLAARVAELEQRETVLVLYTSRFENWNRVWRVEEIGSAFEVTDRTWPKYVDRDDSMSGAEPPVTLGVAQVGPVDGKWGARCRTASGCEVVVGSFPTRDAALAALHKAIDKAEEQAAKDQRD